MRADLELDESRRLAIRETASRFRTTNPRRFGSVLSGTQHEGSDVGLLVDALPGDALLDLGGLQMALQPVRQAAQAMSGIMPSGCRSSP